MLYTNIAKPILFKLSAERAHNMVIQGLDLLSSIPGGLAMMEQKYGVKRDQELATNIGGIDFANPIGLAAGLDKNAVAIRGFSAIGFGFMEVGTVTPKPQSGNELPRLFRLPEDLALVNRMGFNNVGTVQMARNLAQIPKHKIPIAINIGKNKLTSNDQAEEDYRECIRKLYNFGDFFVVNISSPNTPDLRNLQHGDDLRRLLAAVKEEMEQQRQVYGGKGKACWVKIAPDITTVELKYMVETIMEAQISGIVATNTTTARTGLQSRQAVETGGLSGKPLRDRSTEVIRQVYSMTGGTLPIIGCGGIFTAEDAYLKIRAGASLVEVYTALIYEGPSLLRRLNHGLLDLLRKDGYRNISQAVGVDCPTGV